MPSEPSQTERSLLRFLPDSQLQTLHARFERLEKQTRKDPDKAPAGLWEAKYAVEQEIRSRLDRPSAGDLIEEAFAQMLKGKEKEK
jgi:hypothetical protein